jgi:hypothetical protein
VPPLKEETMTLRTELRLQLAMKVVTLVIVLVINWQLWQMRQTLDEMIANAEAAMERLK